MPGTFPIIGDPNYAMAEAQIPQSILRLSRQLGF
jgi:hypothetical protein